jgi:putative addiction module killer protein
LTASLPEPIKATCIVRFPPGSAGNLGKNRSVGEGVYELKIDYGPGYRVYYGLDKKTMVLLLLGGDKSSQTKDIVQARMHWEDHKRRKKNG